MIPKTIHYCWFGRNPLPDSALRCIASWRKYLPDYEIIEWNEDNFDVNSIPYTAQAYAAKKYAFVSDYARFKILYEHGGVYFDTDVEVIRPFDHIISRGAFLGTETGICVNPGLGMGASRGMQVYGNILEYYSSLKFIQEDGSFNIKDAVVNITTCELLKHGLTQTSEVQTVADINIYPSDYFNPFDDATGRLNKTDNTYSIHWYSKTWLNTSPLRQLLSRMFHRVFGTHALARFRR